VNKNQKKELEETIIQKIGGLKEKISAFQDLSKPISPDNAIGRLTRMEAINSRSINQAALAKAKQDLKALEKSLTLIHDPDFGLCINCEEEIPRKRLMIMPESSLCVTCAQKISRH